MCEVTRETLGFPDASRDVLTELLRRGVQEMLATAIESEVAEGEHIGDGLGFNQVVRNGRLPKEKIITGLAHRSYCKTSIGELSGLSALNGYAILFNRVHVEFDT